MRKGDVGYNDFQAERQYQFRVEKEWPIARTTYTKYYLTPSGQLQTSAPSSRERASTVSYEALGSLQTLQYVQFSTTPTEREIEFTGHVVAHLNVSCTRDKTRATSDKMVDLFLTLRHMTSQGTEVLYTGTVGDPVPVSKGWLRTSLRKTNPTDARHTFWHPHRDYLSTEADLLVPGAVYDVDVEIWPTNVILARGERLVFEVSSGDTQGAGIFEHNSARDRNAERFAGMNHLHFGEGRENWVLMPEIP